LSNKSDKRRNLKINIMKSMKINVPIGYTIDEEKSTFSNIVFKEVKKEIKERIKSVKDALSELGENDEEVIEYRKLLSIDIADHILNNQIAVIIMKALNEGWKADWSDSNQYKYYPYFTMNDNTFAYDSYCYWLTYSHVSSRLALKNSDLAIYAGNQFTEVYKKFMK
jgi:hypothetical protein